jgi:hypothetical protein
MTRTVTISVSSALLILVLAFGGNVLAQTADPNQGPLNAILKALGLIQTQTATIADSVAAATGDLKVVDADLRAVAQAVAGGQEVESRILKAESQILQELQGLELKIDNLQGSQRPAPSAHRLWVSPYWANSLRGGDGDAGGSSAILGTNALLVVLNPGDIEAAFDCIFLDQNGTVTPGDGLHYAAPGAWSGCEHYGGRFANGWLIVTSDRPVLPNGSYVDDRDLSSAAHRTVQAIEFHPIDCTNPADDTVSFACRYAKPAR